MGSHAFILGADPFTQRRPPPPRALSPLKKQRHLSLLRRTGMYAATAQARPEIDIQKLRDTRQWEAFLDAQIETVGKIR